MLLEGKENERLFSNLHNADFFQFSDKNTFFENQREKCCYNFDFIFVIFVYLQLQYFQ